MSEAGEVEAQEPMCEAVNYDPQILVFVTTFHICSRPTSAVASSSAQ